MIRKSGLRLFQKITKSFSEFPDRKKVHLTFNNFEKPMSHCPAMKTSRNLVHGEMRNNTMRKSNCGRSQNWRLSTAIYASVLTASALCLGTGAIGGDDVDRAAAVKTTSPIKHVIILIGENRGLDHTFGTYTPKGHGQTISNLLSKGIVNADGSPGPNYALAQQYSALSQPLFYFGAAKVAKTPYSSSNPMPQPTTGGAPSKPDAYYPQAAGSAPPYYPSCQYSDQSAGCDSNYDQEAQLFASQIPDIKASQFGQLASGWTKLPNGVPDTRIPGEGSLEGPFQFQGPSIGDNDYTGDQTHRFFSAAQQRNCSAPFGSRSSAPDFIPT